MSRYIISTCHSLKLIPIARIARFARFGTSVRMVLLGDAIDAEAVPGSIKVSTTTDNSNIKKKITFERSDVSEAVAAHLDILKVLRLVAVYVDESGKRRIAGSPNWPFSLEYATEGGVFTVTLQGEDIHPDGFLVD